MLYLIYGAQNHISSAELAAKLEAMRAKNAALAAKKAELSDAHNALENEKIHEIFSNHAEALHDHIGVFNALIAEMDPVKTEELKIELGKIIDSLTNTTLQALGTLKDPQGQPVDTHTAQHAMQNLATKAKEQLGLL